MDNTQYTIRSVPSGLDKSLRLQAKKSGKSLNEVLIESLAKGAGVNIKTKKFNDLDWFIGAMKPDAKSDAALNWLESLPKDMR